jgi:long-subunit acyl-CoA synthetase (AMP-forming)
MPQKLTESSVEAIEVSWHLVLDKEPVDLRSDSYPDPIYDPEAILALVYTSGATGRPKGVVLTHANFLANVDHFNYWMPYREGGVYLHAAPIFHNDRRTPNVHVACR